MNTGEVDMMNAKSSVSSLDTESRLEAFRPGYRHRLVKVAGALCHGAAGAGPSRLRHALHVPRPSRDVIVEAVESLRGVLFPGYFGTSEFDSDGAYFHVSSTLHVVEKTMEEQIRRSLCFVCDQQEDPQRCADCARGAAELSRQFIERLPVVQHYLMTDVIATYEGDPAASSPDEAILCYPGLLAMTSYRLAHELHALGVPFIPRIITEHAHGLTGIDIHPGAQIGESFFIDHGTGVVIGETSEIGRHVRLYQGVTLGARSFPLDSEGRPIKGIKRHPIVEDEVVIYSGATILGRVTIGRGAVIGGNVWLTQSVAPGASVTQQAARRESFHLGGGI